MQRVDAADPSGVRVRLLTKGSARIKIEEEQSLDQEVVHTKEQIGYVAIEPGLLSIVEAAAKTSALAAETATDLPTAYALHGNYPNPFNPVTTIRYDLPEQAVVRLEVFDVMGRRIAVLVDGSMRAGVHEVPFHAGTLSSGLYLFRLQANDFTETRKMLLLK